MEKIAFKAITCYWYASRTMLAKKGYSNAFSYTTRLLHALDLDSS